MFQTEILQREKAMQHELCTLTIKLYSTDIVN